MRKMAAEQEAVRRGPNSSAVFPYLRRGAGRSDRPAVTAASSWHQQRSEASGPASAPSKIIAPARSRVITRHR
jgi:hypothetical protein